MRIASFEVKKMSKPIEKIKAGAISVTIWENDKDGKKYYTISLDRVFKNNDQWQTTNALRINDLPKASLLLSKAYEFLITKA